MKDWILFLVALGFGVLGIMEVIGVFAAGIQWWVNMFS